MLARTRLPIFAFVTLASAAVAASGCKVSKCKDAQGNEIPNCVTVQTPTKYKGTTTTQTAAWSTGVGVVVSSGNGEVTVLADGGDPTKIAVDFHPFAFEYDEAAGVAKLASKLSASVGLAGGKVSAVAHTDDGAAGYDVVVHLPAAFDGALDVEQQNGAVSLEGIASASSTRVVSENGGIDSTATLLGNVFVSTKNGGVTLRATPAGAGNLVRTDNGSVALVLVGSPNLTVQATAETGSVTIPDPLPASWAANGSGGAYALTIGAGAGALEVSSGNGDVVLSASN